jgi:DNA-binding GntR family transcriptional regulator
LPLIGNLRMTINIMRNVSMMVDFEEAAYASISDHRSILALMRAGDQRKALKALRDHMKTHYRNIVREYRQLYG